MFFGEPLFVAPWIAKNLFVRLRTSSSSSATTGAVSSTTAPVVALQHGNGWISRTHLFSPSLDDLPLRNPLGYISSFSGSQFLGETLYYLAAGDAVTVLGKLTKRPAIGIVDVSFPETSSTPSSSPSSSPTYKIEYEIGTNPRFPFGGVTVHLNSDAGFLLKKTTGALLGVTLGSLCFAGTFLLWK
jgi:hypothetical protein